MKVLIYILVSILLFSCNVLNDEEMEIRLAELELMELANEHLEDDIDELWRIIDGKVAVSQTKEEGERRQLIAQKNSKVDSIVNLKLLTIDEALSIKEISSEIKGLYQTVNSIIGEDSLQHIFFNNSLYYDSTFSYPFSRFNSELKNSENEFDQFISKIISPSELEWKEIKILTKSYLLLMQKRTFLYLEQKMATINNFIPSNELFISVEYEKSKIIRTKNIEFNVFISNPYLRNILIRNVLVDSSKNNFYANFNKYKLRPIKISTNTIGSHTIDISQYFHNHKNSTFHYNYEVIEKQ